VNQINTFSFEGSRPVRTIEVDGKPLFVAKDVAEALGYVWQRNLVGHVPSELKGVKPINTLGGTQAMAYLSEGTL